MNELRVLDLFSGIGGFSLGLKRAGGFRTVAYCETDKAARYLLMWHANAGRLDVAPAWDDVGTLPRFGGVDLVTAGWPCQGNSIAGRREGMRDARSGLWGVLVEVLRDFRPQWFLGENVPGLLSVNGGRDFLSCLRDLDDLGYGVCWRVLDAQFFGVPQRRRRVFVVGHLGAPCPPEILFEPEGRSGDSQKGRKAGEEVAFSLRANPSRSGDKGDGGINCTMISSTVTAREGKGTDSDATTTMIAAPITASYGKQVDSSDTSKGPPNLIAGTLKQRMRGATDEVMDTMIAAPLTAGGHPNSNAPGRRKEDDVNLVAHALTAEGCDASEDGTGRGTPIIGCLRRNPYNNSDATTEARQLVNGVRRLTPTECERLQGFQDGWTAGQADSTRYKQLGNAVAVPVIEWIGRRIRESLTL